MDQVYGYIYAREDQEAMRMKETLKKMSVPEKNIFIDEISESGKERVKLQKMERKIKKEDVIYVKSLSFLGSSYDEISKQWEFLTKEQKADVVILDEPLLDTRRGKEIMGSFVSDIVLETLEFVAENEHEKNSSRQVESYLAAKAKGVRYGRPLTPLPENFDSVYQQWKAGNITGVRAAEECGMPLSSFRYRANIYEKEQGKSDKRRQKATANGIKVKENHTRRPSVSLPKNFVSVYQQWEEGNITGVKAAEECGMSLSSFRYHANILYEAKQEQQDLKAGSVHDDEETREQNSMIWNA